MGDGYVKVLDSADPSAKPVDNETVTVQSETRYRQRVAIPDGSDAATGSTADASSANTVVGLLKAVKAAVTGTLATSRTWVLSSGTDSVAATLAAETTKVIGTVNVAVGQTIAATGPLTDTQLRVTAVPISGTVTASGPLTDTQLRASAVPVSLTALPTLGAVSNTAFGLTGTDGVTAGLSATVKQHNGNNVVYVRDPALVDLLSDILLELRLLNSVGASL